MARDSPFQTSLDPVRKLPVRTGVTVLVTVVLFKCVFSCPCVSAEETALHCWLYLLLPVSVMVLLLSLVDSRLLRLCQCHVCRCCARAEGACCADGCCYTPSQCGEEACYCCSVIGSYVIRVLCASALWLVVALTDGDWYVCMRTVPASGTGQDQLACKDLPSPEEAEVLRRFSSESRVFFGDRPPVTLHRIRYAVHDPLVIIPTENRWSIILFIIITILVFVIIALLIILGLSLLLVVHTCIMSRRKPYYKSVFEAYVEQETTAILEEKLHEQAVERAKLLSESVLRCVQSRHEDCGLEDGYIRYQPLAETEENMWRKMSHPAFHLLGVRIHS